MNEILRKFNCKYEEFDDGVNSKDSINIINGLKCDMDEVEISNCCFNEELQISSFTCNSIVFRNCKFRSNVDIRSTRSKISFLKCIFENKISLFKIIGNINFEESSAENVLYEESNIDSLTFKNFSGNKIACLKTRIGELKLIQSSINNIRMQKSSDVEKFLIRRSTIELLEIKMFRDLEYSNSNINNIKLSTINIKEFRKIFMTKNKIDINRGYEMLLAIYSSFLSRNLYGEIDKCLLLLRDFECMSKIYTKKSIVRKVIYNVQYFILGKMFGWGIKISNNICTALAVIFAYACIYTSTLESIKKGLIIENFKIALKTSVNRFFNIGNTQYTYTLLSHLDTQESIIGIILMTIVTGVIVRKIIK